MKVFVVTFERREEESSYTSIDSAWSSEELAEKRRKSNPFVLASEVHELEIDPLES